LNGKYQLLVYADYINLLGENINIVKNTEALLDTSKKVCLEVNADKTKYVFIYHRTTGQNHYIKVTNKFSENVATFKYLQTTFKN
jgi:hypothetical protein